MNKKKSNAGRKPVQDKKVQVSLYVEISKIEKFGGIENYKSECYKLAEKPPLNEANV